MATAASAGLTARVSIPQVAHWSVKGATPLPYGAMATPVGDGVVQIDTALGGWERVTAGYLLTGLAPVLVETGSQSSLPTLLGALDELGVGPSDLAGVVVTHVHLDHAGGVGDVAKAFPGAVVHVHPLGARHLADPTRLVDSSARVYGELLDRLYGRITPTPAERISALEDGQEIRVGPDRRLTAVHAPGHAKHHLGIHDSATGMLFTGDAVGVRLPDAGVLRPATPPPDFDLDQALDSLRRFDQRSPTALALAHFGVLADAADVLAEAAEALRRWADVAERAWRDGADMAQALEAAFATDVGGLPAAEQEKLETLNGVHSNAAGLRRWLDKRREGQPGQ